MLAALCLLLPAACVLNLSNLASGGSSASSTGDASMSSNGSGSGGSDAGDTSSSSAGTGTGGSPAVTAAQLLALTSSCKQLAGSSKLAPADGAPRSVPICTLDGAIWYQSAMSIGCDGGQSTPCTTAPGYSPDTDGTDSMGDPLNASTLPFVVVPSPGDGFDFMTAGLSMGSVAAVLYLDRLVYAVIGDEGDEGVAGEGSYALAMALGIDPNPETGGVSSGVTYILFTGPGAVVLKSEVHAEAVTLGGELASMLVADN